MKHDNSNQNPWAGLSSYEDPAKSTQKLKFCGRDNETKEVTRLIDDNFFVTLYGKSGIGKTSLLNAGVFPALRREQYTPLSLRLGMTDEALTYPDVITDAIERAIEECGGSVRVINVVDEQTDRSAIDYLWNWFARHSFLTADGQATFPVIVFDQFEEVFRHPESRQKTEVLLTQLHYLIDESHALNDCIVNGEPYYYDFNFRFVLSIREDDLYRLEDSIDNCALTALKRCRYRLRSLSEQSAEAVILVPGEGLFKEEDQKGIVDTIIDIARNKEDKSISTNVLSLICSRIFVDFQKSGADHITPSLVDTFIKGNPFERFYNEATRGFSNKEKSYIEDNLVDTTGRRNSIPESNFLKHVPKGIQLLEGDTRILQRASTSSDGGNYRIELIHDSFCDPLAKMKEKRDRQKKIIMFSSYISLALFCIGLAGYFIYLTNSLSVTEKRRIEAQCQKEEIQKLNQSLQSQIITNIRQQDSISILVEQKEYSNTQLSNVNLDLRNKEHTLIETIKDLQIIKARFISEKVIGLVDNGNSYLARLLALQALPPYRPYTPEAEEALSKAVMHNSAILRGHTSSVWSTAFSPDGKHIVSASSDNTVRIWDAETGRELRKLEGHTDTISSAAFNFNGKRIVSASWDNTIKIWDAETGRELRKFVGHTAPILFAAFSPDGKRIVSASWDKTIRIWDSGTGRELRKIEGHTHRVNSAVFSPDGKRIVSASWDKTIRIWNAETGREICKLEGHTDVIEFASFSPNGKRIVSASADKTSRIWDAETGREIHKMEGHTGAVNSVNYSPDGKRIVSASADKTSRIWDSRTGRELRKLEGNTSYVLFATFSPNSKRIVLALGNNISRIWDVEPGGEHLKLEGHKGIVKSALFSPNGKQIVSASADNTARIWDSETGRELYKLEGHIDIVNFAIFSPNGKYVVSASADKTVRVWDIETGREFRKLEGHTDIVNFATFSPNGKYVVSASDDNTVRVWDIKTGGELHKMEQFTRGFFSPTFSYAGKYIVLASDDNSVRIWDMETGREIHKLKVYNNKVRSATLSPNGKLIVLSTDKTMRIWNVETERELFKLEGHTDNIRSTAFSLDGKRIISASSDYTVRIWDAETGQELRKLEGHIYGVNSAAFSPDSKRIVSASDDNTIRIWDFPPLQELINSTQKRFKNRPLTTEERRKYYLE